MEHQMEENTTIYYVEADAINYISGITSYNRTQVDQIMRSLWQMQDDGIDEAYKNPAKALADYSPHIPHNIINDVIDAETCYLEMIGAIVF